MPRSPPPPVAQLRLVRPMRTRLAVTLAMIASLAEMRAQNISAMEQEYIVEATNVARRVLVAEFSKHPERVRNLSITFSFQVDARGATAQRESCFEDAKPVGHGYCTSRTRRCEVPIDSETDRSDWRRHGQPRGRLQCKPSTIGSNQTMKPTAPLRCNFSVFATTPCVGLSLSR